MPDVFTISSCKSQLPDIGFGYILVYLSSDCGWGQDRIRHYKDDNAYKLYQQNHISNVVYHQQHGHIKPSVYLRHDRAGSHTNAGHLWELKALSSLVVVHVLRK